MPRYTVYSSANNIYFICYGTLRTTFEGSIKAAFKCILKGRSYVSADDSNYMKSTFLFGCDSYQDAVDNYPEYFI